MNNPGYHTFSRILHWAVAGMIVLQYVLAKLAERAEDADQTLRQLALLANHKSVGITILTLVIVRFGWRLLSPPPALPPAMPRWQTRASQVSHWTLYGLLFAVPLTGWLMSSASAYSVSWFNLFQLPDLIGASPELKELFEEIHETLAKLLFVVSVIHILAALKHGIVDRDGVLGRMSSGATLMLFVAIIGVGVYVLGTVGKAQDPAARNSISVPKDVSESGVNGEPTSGIPAQTAPDKPQPTPLPTWKIDYDSSYIRFIGNQAGADFTGTWDSWEAQIRFASDRLANSSFDVTVATNSSNTRDAERDAAMQDPDWFDSENFPSAFFRANEFSGNPAEGYLANGQLTIKGLSSPVVLEFSVEENGDQRVLNAISQSRLLVGSTLLDRLALGVGTGEWEDTTWVGQEVRVEVRVQASVDNPTEPPR